jgi:hypothetical protein
MDFLEMLLMLNSSKHLKKVKIMNNKLVEYFKSINGLKFKPGIECNSMGLNILDILYSDHHLNKEVKEIINDLNTCNNFLGIKKLIKKYGNFEKYLKLYGYKEVNDRILPGDFLIKKRRYINDIIYCLDSITYVGIGLTQQWDQKSNKLIISRDIIISDKHKIWRK